MRSYLQTAAVLAGLTSAVPAAAQADPPDKAGSVNSLQSLATLTGVPIPLSKADECLLKSNDGGFAAGVRLPGPVRRILDLPSLHDERFRVESHGVNHTATLTNAGYHLTAGGPFGPESEGAGYWILSLKGNQLKPSQWHGSYVSDLLRIQGELTEKVRLLAIDFLTESAEFHLRARTGEPLRWSARVRGDFGDLRAQYHQKDGAAAWYSLSRPGQFEIWIGAELHPESGRRVVQARIGSPFALAEFAGGRDRQSDWFEAGLGLSARVGKISLLGRGTHVIGSGSACQILIDANWKF